MGYFEQILGNLVIFQLVTDIISVTLGAGLCFGALKWRRGLLTTTAIGWGLALGFIVGMLLGEIFGEIGLIVCIIIGFIILPILTYTVPGVNRFVLGFLVSCKLFFMLTTVLAKSGSIDLETTIFLPLIAGTITGVGLMAWTRMRVSAFILGCTFIGASGIAPVVSEWINRILYGVTGDINYLFDPIDLIFALFKVELTDIWMLITMIVLMVWGSSKQIRDLKNKGISPDTPVIGFEVAEEDNGKIYTR